MLLTIAEKEMPCRSIQLCQSCYNAIGHFVVIIDLISCSIPTRRCFLTDNLSNKSSLFLVVFQQYLQCNFQLYFQQYLQCSCKSVKFREIKVIYSMMSCRTCNLTYVCLGRLDAVIFTTWWQQSVISFFQHSFNENMIKHI